MGTGPNEGGHGARRERGGQGSAGGAERPLGRARRCRGRAAERGERREAARYLPSLPSASLALPLKWRPEL